MDDLAGPARWLAGLDWGGFALSPGLGGLAAVLAASIAYAGLRRAVHQQREAARKQQWWDRARWALDLTLADDSARREVGFEMLDALATSEWAAEHEADVVDAAIQSSLRRVPEDAGADADVRPSAGHERPGTTSPEAPWMQDDEGGRP